MITSDPGSDEKRLPGGERHWRALCHRQALPRYMQTDHACGVEPWRAASTCLQWTKDLGILGILPFRTRTHSFVRSCKMASLSVPTPTSTLIFTTFFTPTGSGGNNPALTTFYTPPPACRNQWLLPSPDDTELSVYSTAPDAADTRAYSRYVECQPLKHDGFFSPGICPGDRTIQALGVYQFSTSGTLATHYEARCCPRYATRRAFRNPH